MRTYTHTFYVILSDWNDVLRRVVAWAENPYIAITYFKEYQNLDSDAEMVTIECDSHLTLASVLNERYETDVREILDAKLMTKTSYNDRCYVIYAARYREFFSHYFLQNMKIITHVCEIISKMMLSIAPLMKYLHWSIIEDIVNVTYNVYGYTSIRKLLRNGPIASPLWEMIDIVYFWRFINLANPNQTSISFNGVQFLPVEAIFIDSN